jgi:uncharacterized protein
MEATLVVKATRLCNLRCSYCHDWRVGPDQTMSTPVLASMTRAALADMQHDAVHFVWHGGEATMLPLGFFRQALTAQAMHQRPGQVVRNTIQSNGTRITPAWARFLKANDFRVGVSLDGPPEVHDRERRYAGGGGSMADVISGMRVLRDHGVPFHVLMVVGDATLALGADSVFDFFVQHGIDRYGFNAVTPVNQPDAAPGTPTVDYVDPRRMTEFLIGIDDRWRAHGDPLIWIRELEAIRRRVRGDAPGYCKLAGGCLGRYYIVEPNGDTAHCDLFLGDPAYELGNVTRDGFAAMRASATMAALVARRGDELDAMRSCAEFTTCNGWCPHERYLAARHDPRTSAGCCGLANLIGHIRARETGAVPTRPRPLGVPVTLGARR